MTGRLYVLGRLVDTTTADGAARRPRLGGCMLPGGGWAARPGLEAVRRPAISNINNT